MASTAGPFSMVINTGTFVNSRPKGNIAGSQHYLWYDGDRLGDGATGTVYVGREKATGDLCAIKTFNAQAMKRSSTVQSREFDVLSKLRHVNIVKILAMEEQLQDDARVLVMELCTGGSLYSILEHPANQFGLAESEFLLVLEHVTSGMKHLRDKGIIHRDLKPGNIMRFVTDSGESIYKLVDFGAARELDDEEQFQSLYGTEEYLLPDMYESAVLDKQRKRQFSARCDLWSLGVTFYHAATGSLPFRPYGGRRNRPMMLHITTTKMPGVISGVQYAENGPIQWSTSLPSTCRLSRGLKHLIRQLLAGMLEPDAAKMMKFDQFFQNVHSIVTKVPVHVFNVASGDMLSIYDNPVPSRSSSTGGHLKSLHNASTSSTSHSSSSHSSSNSHLVLRLQDAIARQSEVPISDQILIYDGVSLDVGLGVKTESDHHGDRVGGGCGGSDDDSAAQRSHTSLAESFSEFITEELLLSTHPNSPIFVLPRTADCMKWREPKLPLFDAWTSEVELSADVKLAKQYCSVMYSISRQIATCCQVQAMLASVRRIMSRSLKSAIGKLMYFKSAFKTRMETLESTIQFAKTSQMAFSALCGNGGGDASLDVQPQIESVSEELGSLEKSFGEIRDSWQKFRSLCRQEIRTSHYDDCPPPPTCAGHSDPPCSNSINAIIEESTRIMNDFRADRKLEGNLPFNTEQIHKYDKHRFCGLRERSLSQVQGHCFYHTKLAHSQFVSWYDVALKHLNLIESRISPMKFDLDFKASLLSSSLGHLHLKLDHIHKHILKSAVVVKNGCGGGGGVVSNNNSSSSSSAVDEKRNRKLAQLLDKVSKDTERNKVSIGKANEKLHGMQEELKGLEIVDKSAASITIGGADSFFSHDPYAANASYYDSISCHGDGDSA